eukprot:1157528-Pelagomonas_calceolata.AAC.1
MERLHEAAASESISFSLGTAYSPKVLLPCDAVSIHQVLGLSNDLVSGLTDNDGKSLESRQPAALAAEEGKVNTPPPSRAQSSTSSNFLPGRVSPLLQQAFSEALRAVAGTSNDSQELARVFTVAPVVVCHLNAQEPSGGESSAKHASNAF